MNAIAIINFLGCGPQDKIGVELRIDLQISAYIGNFLTIEMAMESADRALFSRCIDLNEAYSLNIPRGGLCVNAWPKIFLTRRVSRWIATSKYGTSITLVTFTY
jgi:hypothetical protein